MFVLVHPGGAEQGWSLAQCRAFFVKFLIYDLRSNRLDAFSVLRDGTISCVHAML